MLGKWKMQVVGAVSVAALAGVWLWAGNRPTQQEQRTRLTKAANDGNFKDAYEGLRKLALDPKDDPLQVGPDLTLGLSCLQRLGRVDEMDEFIESVVAVHKDNWRLLETAAKSYATAPHGGFIIAGKFYRGGHRGGGRQVGSMERDRTRALQLMQQALANTKKEGNKADVAQFCLSFADMLLNGGGYHEPWRLQYLTDLTQLPDYEEGGGAYPVFRGGRGGRFPIVYRGTQGAPVDEQGNPVYHRLPKSYEAAKTDGERWRWLLMEAAELDPGRLNESEMILANFLRQQFGEQTMAYVARSAPDSGQEKTGTFALHTLKDNETIAQLATGVKRFSVPDEFNWIKIYRRVAGRGKTSWGEKARDTLADIFENRRQYVKAASAWKDAIGDYGAGKDNFRQKRLDQIVGNWGRFEPGQVQPAGKGATVDFRYRNGNKVSLEAYPVNVAKLLEDVKAYLKASPNHLDYNHLNIGNIGFRLVERQEHQYLGPKAAGWDLGLRPRPGHVDDQVTVTTPLQKPGAYLLKAQMADGNLSRIIIWVSDTVILKKQLDGKAYYFIADAVNGRPVPKAAADFFGWRQVQVAPGANQFRVETASFSATSDKDGQILVGQNQVAQNYQWLIVARKAKDGNQGADRFAYLGFTGMWFNRIYDPDYNATRVFAITDRPVYRPQQTAHFKVWVRHAKYDQADTSSFANQDFTVEIREPRGEKILEKDFHTDEYGGLSGELPLSRGAMLGAYSVQIKQGNRYYGGTSFRVEEYKKPEFEVKVEAPTEPVRLGEKITATIKANYYFGAPVTSAKVKYKVLRTSYTSNWYPRGDWDWMYGAGYWWFAPNYDWYPGWHNWGMARPIPWWIGRGFEQPEVVLENEVPVGPDGTVAVVIDTLPAKEMHGNQDHAYSITAEVVDESRRTIVGTGKVLVSRKPFQVAAWVNRGYYHTGDTIQASFRAQTLDQKPVQGKGELTLYRITYNAKSEPIRQAVETWKLDTNDQGKASQQIKAAEPGQYRLSYKVTDAKKHTIEGGYIFVVRGEGFDGRQFRFNDIELVTDKREYKPGEQVKLMINTQRTNGTVLLFVRPTNGIYLEPKVLRLAGKSTVAEVGVVQKDMPNFFVEALTVSDGRVHTEVREVVVPPEKRVLNVDVVPSQQEYKPGQKATVKVRLTDFHGKPFVGSTVLTVYDRSVEYIASSNVPEIKEFFWKWRRSHHSQTETSLAHYLGNLLRQGETPMSNLGIFGATVVDELSRARNGAGFGGGGPGGGRGGHAFGAAPPAAPGAMPEGAALRRQAADGQLALAEDAKAKGADRLEQEAQGPAQPGGPQQPTVRRNFADTAYWNASLTTDKDGLAEVTFPMPENLTGWKIRVWAMGHGTKVGQGEVVVTTKKDLLVRLQAPRFFVEKDEVVLSANVHNYLKADKQVAVSLELGGNTLSSLDPETRQVKIAAGGEKRLDWRVKVLREGDAIVRMKAVTDDDSDAMEMRFPCFVHGMLKMESYTGVIRPDKDSARVNLNVPAERRINETRLEIRYSPTLAGAMVDALPYLVDYPYGCTEQTLNRFLPTVITQRILQGMKLDLTEIQKHQTNLNSQEIGNDKERIAKGWKRGNRNPVFSVEEVKTMSQAGINALAQQQLGDGGWGWFSGFGEHSWPHTTAVVVHGLQLARQNGVAMPPGMLERGVAWLQNYQAQQLQLIHNFPTKTLPYKEHVDNIDALVYMVLIDADQNVAGQQKNPAEQQNNEMRELLYRDRNHLAVYAKAMYGLTLHKQQQADKLAMILKNIEQYLVQDNENQTAYLRLPESNYWWCWYGSETEANAYYLKLLSRTSPKDERASRLVKYLLNNRRHATYWNSTRDTAVCIEAMAEYLKASGEDRPDMTVEVWVDGKRHKEVQINTSNLFTYDNKLVMLGDALDSGKHVVEIRRRGTGPVYFNAYLTNFTLEDFITKAGLEVRVNRKYYKLTRDDKEIKVSGARGQALGQRVERYKRTELPNLAELKSGDLVEVEMEIDSKNDYEYLIFEDMKPAGFEPLLVRSGYNANDMGAYMELRDEKVCFFVRALARGKHSVRYRMRAEIPGRFSALPTRAYAMYAPELRGNSDEIKLRVAD
jgi:uncharacterized protein YfaS (alpha-2-macroglobulin family)